jgi:hypothetical protein
VHLSTIVIGDAAKPRPAHGSLGVEPEIRDHTTLTRMNREYFRREAKKWIRRFAPSINDVYFPEIAG